MTLTVRDGRPVAVKTFAGPDADERRDHERWILSSLDGQGAVQLVDGGTGGTGGVDRTGGAGAPDEAGRTDRTGGVDAPGEADGAGEVCELVLAPAGTATLDGARPDGAEVRAIGSSLADTLTRLHALGVGHGAVREEHVIWRPGSRPMLCGFGRAGSDVDPAADVIDLVRMLRRITDDEELDRWLAGTTGDLTTIGRRLGPGATSPAARQLPPPRANDSGGSSRSRRGPSRRLLGALSGAALLGVVVALGVGWWRSTTTTTTATATATDADADAVGPAPTSAPAPRPAADPDGATDTDLDAGARRPGGGALEVAPPEHSTDPPGAQSEDPAPDPAPACEPVTDPGLGVADPDGDGCLDAVRRDGDEVTAGARRWTLGGPDDHVVVGAWECDGRPLPGLVTAADGAVHLFPRWPSERPLENEATAVVGPVDAVEVITAGGCDTLSITTTDGSTELVTP